MTQPSQIGSDQDIDLIKNYGGPNEKEKSSTMDGGNITTILKNAFAYSSIILGGVAVNTVPSEEVNKNPENELYVSYSFFEICSTYMILIHLGNLERTRL